MLLYGIHEADQVEFAGFVFPIEIHRHSAKLKEASQLRWGFWNVVQVDFSADINSLAIPNFLEFFLNHRLNFFSLIISFFGINWLMGFRATSTGGVVKLIRAYRFFRNIQNQDQEYIVLVFDYAGNYKIESSQGTML